MEGGELLELPSSQRKIVQQQFDSYCKIVLKNEARNCYIENQQRGKYEVSFEELSKQEMEQLYIMDEYSIDYYSFNVLGYDIAVKDDLISEALISLPKQKRDIILLSYFLDMTDKEIGEKLNLVRSTVQYQRASSLKQLKNLLKGKINE